MRRACRGGHGNGRPQRGSVRRVLSVAAAVRAGVGQRSGLEEPEPTDDLNEKGEEYFPQLEEACTNERQTDHGLDEEPFQSVVAEQRIGNGKPEIPLLLSQSVLDDVIPFEQTLADDWCAKGANVQFAPNLGPRHIGGAIARRTIRTRGFEQGRPSRHAFSTRGHVFYRCANDFSSLGRGCWPSSSGPSSCMVTAATR